MALSISHSTCRFFRLRVKTFLKHMLIIFPIGAMITILVVMPRSLVEPELSALLPMTSLLLRSDMTQALLV